MGKNIAFIFAIVLVASFTSCEKLEGTEKTRDDIIETEWQLDQVKLAEEDSGVQAFLDLLTIIPIYYDFQEDGKYESYAKLLGQKVDPTNGTWELSDDGKIFILDEVPFDLDIATDKDLEFSASMEDAAGLIGYTDETGENRLRYIFVAK